MIRPSAGFEGQSRAVAARGRYEPHIVIELVLATVLCRTRLGKLAERHPRDPSNIDTILGGMSCLSGRGEACREAPRSAGVQRGTVYPARGAG
jgi:hypothetical protein